MAQASNAPGMTSATRRDEARRKRIRVLQLRAAGESFDAIAQQVGYQSRGNAHRAYEQAMSEVTVAGVTEMRRLENERLDTLLRAVWPAAKRGEVPSVNAALRIMDRRAKLNGGFTVGVLVSTTENRAPPARAAATTWLLPNAQSPRTRMSHPGRSRRCR